MDSTATRRFNSYAQSDDLQLVLYESQVDRLMQTGTLQTALEAPNSTQDISPIQAASPVSLFNVVKDQIIIKLGDIQSTNIYSNEVLFSTSKMVFELFYRLVCITLKDESQVKDVIKEILFKYRDRYKAIADGRNLKIAVSQMIQIALKS